ncbi:bifunctional diguanylate cyclase/phosphodiesterase [Noviherbaspirillum galbum]|uniref:EAL domain-containing protein n=1 Tax=Noviherbaspirillum galbum TaxID=2709383 RepID=A0A6B3SSM1_9BURK|nr:EAL domain-containing protein [Noviherbaspirillum galbum]NEX63950.1 EAL domain-containing protein [Noviherbaspirillum galbum]
MSDASSDCDPDSDSETSAPLDETAPFFRADSLTAGNQGSLFYQLAAEAARIGTWQRNLSDDTVTICPVMATMLQMEPAYHVFTRAEWQGFYRPEELDIVEKHLRQHAGSGEPFSYESRVILQGGKEVWLLVRGMMIRDDQGEPVHIAGVSIDITSRKIEAVAIEAEHERFRLLAELCPDAILVISEGRYVYANREAARLFGVAAPANLVGRLPEEFIDARSLREVNERLSRAHQEKRGNLPATWTVHRKDGTQVHVQAVSAKTRWADKPALEMVVRDVTADRLAAQNLHLMSERLKLAIEGTGEGIWDWDPSTGSHTLSGELKKILGYEEDEVMGAAFDWRAVTHPDDQERVAEAMQACLRGDAPVYQCEYRLRSRDGRWKWVLSRGVVVSRDEQLVPRLVTGMILDITAKKESDELIWRHANLDALTGLPNRRYFREQLDAEVRMAARHRRKIALLFLDLDGFKQVNDLHGHDAGDLLLVEAARRIKRCVRATDIVARLGGDEFTVLITALDTESHIEPVCRKILDSIGKPFTIGNDVSYVTGSIGIALSPMDASTPEDMLRMADKAMYAAKANGKNQFSYFTAEMDTRARERLRLCNDLRKALAEDQLFLCYQPVVALAEKRIVKAEALLRWRHPRLGVIDPGTFIPLAEESGLMGQIGNWVFQEVGACAKHWSERIGEPFQIGINKSPVQFMAPDPGAQWLEYLERLGLSGNNIIIEISESQLLQPASKVIDALETYHHAGMQVAIDDFGTGYSSMSVLQKFHVDYLKIDPSFVQDLATNHDNRTIAETIIVMAHKLGLKVIAEGVETQEQRDFLTEAGCDYAQGFYFSHPVQSHQLDALLTHQVLH